MVAGIWWWMVGALQSSPSVTTAPTRTTTANKPPHPASTNGNGGNKPSASADKSTDDGAEDNEDPDFDPLRTSWQNPFFKSHWQATGWQFTPQAMQSNNSQSPVATFRRQYRKLTVECRLAPIGKPGEFHVALFAPETETLMRAEFSGKQVKLTATIKRTVSTIKRRKFPVDFSPDKTTTLRLTATGNRVRIICDGKVVLNSSQPAEQSGKSLELSLRSIAGAFRISDLHLEGE